MLKVMIPLVASVAAVQQKLHYVAYGKVHAHG